MLLFQYKKGNPDVWFETMTDGVSEEILRSSVAIGTDVVHSGAQLTGNEDGVILKTDAYGAITWQKLLAGAGNDDLHGLAADSSGNIYVAARTSTGLSGASFAAAVVKYNSAGVVQWQRKLEGAAASVTTFDEVVVDSNGDVLASGYTNTTGTTGDADMLIVKYSSAGVLQWQKYIGGVNFDRGQSVTLDSSDNIYLAGRISGGTADMGVMKLDPTASTISWERILSEVQFDLANSVSVDGSGNVYIAGRTDDTGTSDDRAFVAKYNNSGVIQWQRIIVSASGPSQIYAIECVGSDIYVAGQLHQTVGANDGYVAKLDASGNVTWQTTASAPANELDSFRSVQRIGDSLYISGRVRFAAGVDQIIIGRVPEDGSGAGTYGSIVYSVPSGVTVSNSTLTESAGSSVITAGGLTESAMTLTESNASLTATRHV